MASRYFQAGMYTVYSGVSLIASPSPVSRNTVQVATPDHKQPHAKQQLLLLQLARAHARRLSCLSLPSHLLFRFGSARRKKQE